MSDFDGMQADSFSETTHTSWLSRLGQSVVGVLIGIVLVIGALVLLFWNEGRAITTARSLVEGQGAVVEADSARIDPANEGKLIHVSGSLAAAMPLSDPDFGVSMSAARLVRIPEMYQWKEESRTETRKNLGGSEDKVTTYSYVKTWSQSRIDSGLFKRPDGHGNPQMRYARFEAVARDAKLGAFTPGPQVLRRLAADETWRVDPSLADPLHQRIPSATVADGQIYIGGDPAQPQIGDFKISYRIAGTGPASLIGSQNGTDLNEFQTKAGDRLLLANAGTVSAGAMFKAAEEENRILTWILRAIGTVLVFIGWALIMRPFVVLGSVVPLIGDVLAAGTGAIALLMTAVVVSAVIAVAWLWYRPLVSLAVAAGGVAIVVAVRMLKGQRTALPAGAR
jgi:hypothetical protein